MSKITLESFSTALNKNPEWIRNLVYFPHIEIEQEKLLKAGWNVEQIKRKWGFPPTIGKIPIAWRTGIYGEHIKAAPLIIALNFVSVVWPLSILLLFIEDYFFTSLSVLTILFVLASLNEKISNYFWRREISINNIPFYESLNQEAEEFFKLLSSTPKDSWKYANYSLYLRSFAFDDFNFDLNVEWPLLQKEKSFDSWAKVNTSIDTPIIYDSYHNSKSLMCVGNKNKQSGIGNISFDLEDWKETIKLLINNANRIYFVPDISNGVLWEIDYILRKDILHKIIFIMPPRKNSKIDIRLHWDDCARVYLGYGLKLPNYNGLGCCFYYRANKIITDGTFFQRALLGTRS